MKKQVDTVDATPSKRLYLSIIADYDLDKGICELIPLIYPRCPNSSPDYPIKSRMQISMWYKPSHGQEGFMKALLYQISYSRETLNRRTEFA